MKKDRKYIGRSAIAACILFAVCLCVGVGSIGTATFYKGMVQKYQAYLSGIIHLSLTEIDGEVMKECIASMEKSQSYEETQVFLNKMKDNYEISYIYIVKPVNLEEKDNMMYVMTGETREEAMNGEGKTSLGELSGEEYSTEVVSRYMEQMNRGGEILYYANKTEFGYMYTGLAPIADKEGNGVAILAVDISMDEIADTLKAYVVRVFLWGGFLTAAFAGLLYLWMRKRVVRPVEALEHSARNFVKSSHGEKDPRKLLFVRPDISTEDEMEFLADAICTMSEDMKTYMNELLLEARDKERIASELNVATKIQADMLPSIFPAFPGNTEFDIYASMRPAKEVGGDFYDFFMVDKGHLAIVMADVSGKGVPAALFMVVTKTLIKNHVQNGEALPEVLERVNNQLCENNETGMFVTAWLGILDIHTGYIEYVNAGHNFPVIVRGDGAVEWVRCEPCFVLAGMEGMPYTLNQLKLEPLDKIYLYTDGVTEALNQQGELYGEERLEHCLRKKAVPSMDTEELLMYVAEELKGFVGEAEQADDITMLGLQLKEKSVMEGEGM